MTSYVAGFLFDDEGARVALVRKNRPAWQSGRLNGIGGHIEPGETPIEAMRREFFEETGAAVSEWHHFADVTGAWGSVAFFRAFSLAALMQVRTTTDEPIEVRAVWRLPWDQCLPNLSWLIPLARYTHDTYTPIVAWEATP